MSSPGTVAVFGGSGRLGRVIVAQLARSHRVRFSYLSQGRAAVAFAAGLRAQGHDVEAVQVDVRDAPSVEQFITATAGIDGRLAGVVSANGNHFVVAPLQETDPAELRRVLEVDVMGSFHILQSAARSLAAQPGGGAIVVLLTAAVMRTAIYDGMSAIPKAALATMVRQLARDAGVHDVRCNAVAPGVVKTDKVANVAALDPHRRRLVETFIADTPLGRLNDPAGIAALCGFLISDAARDISGQIIGADGGYSA